MTAQTSPVSLFKFNAQDIRVVTLDGAPWFVAKDVCDVLGFVSGNGAGSTTRYLYGLESGERQLVTRHRVENPDLCSFPTRGATCISESGLYKLAMKSRTQTAKDFQNWVTQTVLPSIRKDGGYVLGEEKVATGELSEDELVLKVMQMQAAKVERLKAERDAALKAQALAEQQRDNNRAAADALAATVGEGEESLHDFIRTLDGVNINKVVEYLVEHGYLHKVAGQARVSRAKGGKLFSERRRSGTNPHNGAPFEAVRIFTKAEGRKYLALWYSKGLLPMKKGR